MDRQRLARLRWRMRGAWLWPAFAGLTLLDGLLVHARPLAGLGGTALVPALLLCGFINLFAVAVVGPLAARVLRRRRRDLPRVVALDYAGIALLVLVAVAVAAAGFLHQGSMKRERRAALFASTLARDYVARRGPAAYRRRSAASSTYRIDPERVYRTCVEGPDPRRPYCLVVHLDTRRPTVTFGGYEPNASFAPRGG